MIEHNGNNEKRVSGSKILKLNELEWMQVEWK